MEVEVKQVIIVRSDLNMSRGKESAQVAHASMAWLAEVVTEWSEDINGNNPMQLEEVDYKWLYSGTSKVVLSVKSLEELEQVESDARAAKLTVHKITDAGKTEFHGNPTTTCIAIGPNLSSKIDPITKELKLR